MMILDDMDWFALAGNINQLSLVPFLGLLWTLWHIPSAPRRTVQGFTFYLVFIGVTIPVGIYCRQQLGTPLANVDWLHGRSMVPMTGMVRSRSLQQCVATQRNSRGEPVQHKRSA
jgi:hypothetical protein